MSRRTLVALVLLSAMALLGCRDGQDNRIAELEARVQWLEERAGLHDEEPFPTDIPVAATKLTNGRLIQESDIVYRAMSVQEMFAQGWRPDEIIVSPKHIVGRAPRIDMPPGTPFLSSELYVAGLEPNSDVFAALAQEAETSARRNRSNRPSTIPNSSAAEESIIAYEQVSELPNSIPKASPTHDVLDIPWAGDSGFSSRGIALPIDDELTANSPQDDRAALPEAGDEWTILDPPEISFEETPLFYTDGSDPLDVTVLSDPEMEVQAYEETYEQAYLEYADEYDAYDPLVTPFVLADESDLISEDEWDWASPERITTMSTGPVELPRDDTIRELQHGQSLLPPGDPWAIPLVENEEPMVPRYFHLLPTVTPPPDDRVVRPPLPPSEPGEYTFGEDEVLP